MRLSAPEHRFCATPECPVVYFGIDEVFDREEIVVPVFQKEPAGDRTVCYCFAETEGDIRREIEQTGRSTASERIAELVKAERCACEVRNPQGSCCLGNIAAATKDARGQGAVTQDDGRLPPPGFLAWAGMVLALWRRVRPGACRYAPRAASRPVTPSS